ncbi:Putative_macrophage migration inhibitory factor [Hexamita inflata]|uniref:L-dopachrome isomerase n=1 Tax=Hexamita inflata TaxID=28002 RepID=A0AA86NUP8_9EUKA|nr:Putative macrophage migration inhibitory factor [Hexamita inflata]CAI9925936.1 Putative macrophage migration inhibitory factor [Hexamita inflata]CAI9951399.1 Putative macrophage migration inhibitory factor [Hexamita inflata]
MPCAMISSNTKLDDNAARAFTMEISKVIARVMGKPEAYCMVGYQHSTMVFGGVDTPCAFVQLSAIGGIDAAKNNLTSKALTEAVAKYLQIEANRVYITFNDVKSYNWGFNGSTF